MKILRKIATLPLILTLGIAFWYFVFHLLPGYDIKTASGGLESLDIRWSYTHSDVTQLFSALDTSGQRIYKDFLLMEMFYPLIYGSLLILSMVYLKGKMGRLGKITAWMSLLPLSVVLLDYAENLNTWQMLSSFPTLSESAVRLGSTITMLKWYSASICTGLVICDLLAVLWRNLLWKWRQVDR